MNLPFRNLFMVAGRLCAVHCRPLGARLSMAFVFSLLLCSLDVHAAGVSVRVTGWAQAVAAGGMGRPVGEPATFSMAGDFLPITPGGNASFFSDNYYAGNGSVGITLPSGVVRMEVGKLYSMALEGEWINQLRVSLTAPPGYRMEIDELVRERFTASPTEVFYSHVLVVRVVDTGAPGLTAPVPFGQGSELGATGAYWSVGLGAILNGGSAGTLRLADSAHETSMMHLYTPGAISLVSSTPEVTPHYSPSTGHLHQVITPEGAVVIAPVNSTSYTIKFYRSWQKLGTAYPFEFRGDAFSEFTVQKGAGSDTSFEIEHVARDLEFNQLSSTASSVVAYVEKTSIQRSGYWPTFTWLRTDWHTGTTAVTEAETVSTGTQSARSETFKIRNVTGGAIAYQSSSSFALLNGLGEVTTGSTVGTTSTHTTTQTHYTNSSAGDYGLLKSRTDNGGIWEAYEYYPASDDSPAQPKYIFRPFNISPTSVTFLPGQGEVTYYEYAADAFGMNVRPSLVQTKVNDTVVSRAEITYSNVSNVNGMTLVTAARADRTNNNSTATLTTLTRYYCEDTTDVYFRSLPHSITLPDGVKTAYAYQRGSLSGMTFTKTGSDGLGSGTASRIAVITGTTESPGNVLYETHDGYDVDDLYLVTNKSTLQVTLRNAEARIVRIETYVWTGSGWSLTPVVYENYTYDWNGRIKQREASNGALHTYTWSGEQKETETDATGVKLTYHYDAARRVDYVEKESGGPLAYPQRTTFTYNATGQVLTQTLSAPGGSSETIQTTRVYDNAGRLTSIDPPSSKVGATTISYDPVNRKRTVTAPDGGTKVEETQIDGRLLSNTGSAVVSQFYTYGVETDGRRYMQVNSGTSGSVRWTKAWVDWLGRPVKTERPGFSRSSQINFVEQSFYDDVTIGPGRLYKTTRTGYAPTRFAYDDLGRVVRSGLDIGDNGLSLASTDRISDTDTAYEQISNLWWLTTTNKIYPTANSATAVTTGVSRTRLTGFTGSVQSESQVTDGEGNRTTTTVSVNRSTKTVTTSTTSDGLSNSTTTTTVNGLADKSIGYDGLINELEYDTLGRPWKSIDSRNKTTTTAYYTGTALVETVTDPASVVIQTNDYDTNGRLAWAQNAGGHKVRYAYNTRGQMTHQWGAGAYPLAYGYDPTYGDHTTLSTYRGGSNWDASSWPASTTGPADTTTWTYDGASGLLWRKTDETAKYVSYNYNSRGQVWVRTWARGVTTTYGYDDNTGELTGQDYSDTTPDVTFAYNRLGQLDSATDHTGTWDYVYDAAKPWRQAATPLPSSFYGTRYWIPLYDDSALVGRYKGFRVALSDNPQDDLTGEIEQVYGFSADSARITSLTTKRPNTLAATRKFTYTYKRNAPWIRALGIDGMPDFKVERRYEGENEAEPDSEVTGVSGDIRPLLTKIETKWNSTSIVTFAYTHNNLWQRRVAVQSGTAYADYYPSGGYTAISRHFAYNSRGELETEALYRGAVTGTPSSGDALPGRRDEYRYDSIGNRSISGQTGSAGTSDDEYTPNALNQYVTRENNLLRVAGTAHQDATVQVGGAGVNMLDRTWAADLAPPNSTSAAQAQVAVTSTLTSPTRIKTDSRAYFVPKAMQAFAYDDDGNLTHDSVWDYTWDAENRLVLMEHRSEVMGDTMLTNDAKRRIEFRYDYKGRRVRKTVYGGWNGSVYNITPLSDTKFLYHGWNLIAELAWNISTSTWKPTRSYTWGLDLNGSLTASGGVGALLEIHDYAGAGKTLLPAYDGNGNLVALLNDSTGVLEAVYEYSSFGQLVRSSGTYSAANPFRFSTKFTDTETGLVYYGYRYYSTTLGRFINRDPIAESGGVNLYGFVGNDPCNWVDYLGLEEEVVHMDGGGWDFRQWSINATTWNKNIMMSRSAVLQLADYIAERDGTTGRIISGTFSDNEDLGEDVIYLGKFTVTASREYEPGDTMIVLGEGVFTIIDGSNTAGYRAWRGFGSPKRVDLEPITADPISVAPNSLAAADVAAGGGKPVFNAGDVAGVLNGTPAGQALLGRLRGEFVVKTGDVYLTVTKDGKVVAARDAAGNLVPATGLVGGYVKGSDAPGVIIINNQAASMGTFKGTSAQFYAYVLVQEVNEYDLWKAKTPGNDKAVEVINRVNAENQARAIGLPEAQAGYRTATGAPDVDAIRRDVASNPAYSGPTHGGSYIIRNTTIVVWPPVP